MCRIIPDKSPAVKSELDKLQQMQAMCDRIEVKDEKLVQKELERELRDFKEGEQRLYLAFGEQIHEILEKLKQKQSYDRVIQFKIGIIDIERLEQMKPFRNTQREEKKVKNLLTS